MATGEVQWEMYVMFQALLQAPLYHLAIEGLLIVAVLWLIFRKSYDPQEKIDLTEEEKDALIAEWTPEPLVPPVEPNHPALNCSIVTGKPGKIIVIDGKPCLNLATHNYLGMLENPEVEEAAIRSLRKYGVGSCGPRGFYGTVDVHLEFETKISEFLRVEESILYSYGFATIASCIPPYAKRDDVIFADEGVNFAIQKGLQASHSLVKFFKHNDVSDFERLLQKQKEEDAKNPSKAKITKRFLIVEGIYMNSGDIPPLPELVHLAKEHKVRVFIDESVSFGVLGATGRGVTEHLGVPMKDIDLIAASLENSIASIGGFCSGTSYVVDCQRLTGLGYAFSASLPPMLASGAITALEIMKNNPGIVDRLRTNCEAFHDRLEKVLDHLVIESARISPVKHLRLSPDVRTDNRETDVKKLEAIVNFARKEGVALTVARYLDNQEIKLPAPSIRLTVNALLTNEEIERGVRVVRQASEQAFASGC